MERIPLRESARYDYFDSRELADDMLEFAFGYFYNGSRQGTHSNIIEISVVTWIMDHSENLFIRYCRYGGSKYTWKEKITDQLKILMRDINISEGLINGELRFFEVDREQYFERDVFEKKFLELRSRMKTLR